MKFLFIILYIISISGAAQTNIFNKHIGPEDGLASSETYFVKQDDDDYIWIGTDRGLNKFDGKTFKTYTIENGLSSSFVDKIFINHKNKDIWVRCLNNKLFLYKDDKFIPFAYNNAIAEILKQYRDGIQNIKFENNTPKEIYTNSKGKLILNANGIITDTPSTSAHLNFKIDSVDKIAYGFINKSYTKNDLIVLNNNTIKINEINKTNSLVRVLSLELKNNEYLVSFCKILCKIKNSKILSINQFNSNISSIYQDKNENIWVSFQSQIGIKRYNKNEFPNNENGVTFLSNYEVTGVCQDVENSYWISTHDNGIFYIPQLSISQLEVPIDFKNDEIVNKIVSIDINKIAVGTNKTNIYLFENFKWHNYKLKKFDPLLNKFILFNNESYQIKNLNYSTQTNSLYYSLPLTGIFNLNTLKQEKFDSRISINLQPISNKLLVNCSQNNVELYDLQSKKIVQKIFSNIRNYAALLIQDTLWIGREDGLYYLLKKDSLFSNDFIKQPNFKLNSRVNELLKINNNKIIGGTLGNGIFILENNIYKYISLNNPLFVNDKGYNMVNDIEINNDTIFVATQKGIVWFDSKQDIPTLHYISGKTGILLFDTKSISYIKNHLYVLNQNKIIDIDFLNYEKSIQNLKVNINSLLINDTTNFNINDNVNLKSSQNRIKIFFNSVTFRNGDLLYYQYKLSGNNTDSNWHTTQNNYVEFASLPAGNYTFQLRAINEDNQPSNIVKQFRFTIDAPFYATSWFIISLLILLVSLMFFLNQLRINRIKKQNNLREQLLKYEQQALAAQINPHFIFNSLNSIQSFILKKDERQTLKYLTQFSRLMRLSLDNSRAKWVLPQAEIDLIKVYLELEKLRFVDKFNFSIELDPSLNTDKFLIAPMLAQPFIENAIKHGVNNLVDKKGLITIKTTLIMPSYNVLVQIEDNGIGREQAKKNESELTKNHLSAGVDITINRINLLCLESKKEFYFKIIDKPNNSGTIVEFYLPYKYNQSNY